MIRKAVLLFVCLLAILALTIVPIAAQTAPTPADTPPVIKNGSPANDTPPVLRGGAGPLSSDSKPVPTPSPGSTQDKIRSIKDENEVISVETNLVSTPVSVLDRAGKFIPGLKMRDFKVLENGVPQKITYFQTSEQPFTVILMIDVSPSTRYKMDEIHFAAVTFINQLRPTDKVMVVAFDQRVRVLTEAPTSDRQQIFAAIYKAQMGSGTSLYEAVDLVANLDQIKAPGRKAIVLFTDGVDTTSRRASYQSTAAEIEELDALVYPIRFDTQGDLPGITGSSGRIVTLTPDIVALLASRGITYDPKGMRSGGTAAQYERGRSYLDALAMNSGGRMYEADTIKNLDSAFAGIAEELRRQYSIGYYPDDTGKPGERRQIKIQVARPGVVVRAKNSYVIRQNRAGTEAGTLSTK
jgi:VWFA-related protein